MKIRNIEILIETVICGNKINSSSYYKNMLNNISKDDIKSYAYNYLDFCDRLFGTKADMIKQLANESSN